MRNDTADSRATSGQVSADYAAHVGLVREAGWFEKAGEWKGTCPVGGGHEHTAYYHPDRDTFDCEGPDHTDDRVLTALQRLAATRDAEANAPPQCSKAGGYNHPPQMCLVCVRRQNWVREEAKRLQGLKPSTLEIVTFGQVDLDEEPETPTICEYAPGKGLFRPGSVNGIHGKPGHAKTWVAYIAVVQQVQRGNFALIIDHEMGARDCERRLQMLGADKEARSRVRYVQPDTEFSEDDRRKLIDDIDNMTQPDGLLTIVALDSVGESLPQYNMDSNDDGNLAEWFSILPKWIVRQWPSSTVVIVDHLPKDTPDNRSMYPIGSQRKLAAVDSQFHLKQVAPFSGSTEGHSILICAKDRGGTFARGDRVARLDGGPAGVRLNPIPEESEADKKRKQSDQISTLIVTFLGENPGAKRSEIRKRVPGRNSSVTEVLNSMIEAGEVIEAEGGTGFCSLAPLDTVSMDLTDN